MGTVKSAWEKAMEKIEAIEPLTPEEKEKIKNEEQLTALIADVYRKQMSRDAIWQAFRGLGPALLKEAQHRMLSSLRLNALPDEFQKRMDGILAIESLKENPNTAVVENGLLMIERIRSEYNEIKEGAVEELRAAIEANPNFRMKPVRTPDGRTVLKQTATVDEAVQERLAEYLTEQGKRYEAVLVNTIDRLTSEL